MKQACDASYSTFACLRLTDICSSFIQSTLSGTTSKMAMNEPAAEFYSNERQWATLSGRKHPLNRPKWMEYNRTFNFWCVQKKNNGAKDQITTVPPLTMYSSANEFGIGRRKPINTNSNEFSSRFFPFLSTPFARQITTMSAQKQMFYSFLFCAFVRDRVVPTTTIAPGDKNTAIRHSMRASSIGRANKRNILSNQKQQNHDKHELNLHLVAQKRNENSRSISATNSTMEIDGFGDNNVCDDATCWMLRDLYTKDEGEEKNCAHKMTNKHYARKLLLLLLLLPSDGGVAVRSQVSWFKCAAGLKIDVANVLVNDKTSMQSHLCMVHFFRHLFRAFLFI